MSDVLLEVKDLSVAFRQGGKATLAVDHLFLRKGQTQPSCVNRVR
jgi:hypothetical protein